MKSHDCLTFHQLFGLINARLTQVQTVWMEQHVQSCERCREELTFIRKIQEVIKTKQEPTPPDQQPEPDVQHISGPLLELYYQGTINPSQREGMHRHLAACNDCFHEFSSAARASLDMLTEAGQDFLKQLDAGKVEGRLAKYRRRFETRPVKNYFVEVLAAARLSWQQLSLTFKLGFAVGLILLAFFGYRKLEMHFLIQKPIEFFTNDFIKNRFVKNGELRPSGGFSVKSFTTKSGETLTAADPAPFLNALEIQPNHFDLNHMLGTVYFFNGAIDLAETYYQRALALDDNNAEIHNDLSLIHFHRKDFLKALDCLERALALNPQFPEAHFNKAIVLEAMGKADLAIAAWKTYLDLEVEDKSEWRSEALEHLSELSE
jgi:tetratricopeptide (TPR) repeat protein